jgi:hypothetical protein
LLLPRKRIHPNYFLKIFYIRRLKSTSHYANPVSYGSKIGDRESIFRERRLTDILKDLFGFLPGIVFSSLSLGAATKNEDKDKRK